MTVRHANIAIRPDKPETTTATGLHIPPTNKSRVTGEVVGVGPEVEAPLQVGQKILYHQPNCAEDGGLNIVDEGGLYLTIENGKTMRPLRDLVIIKQDEAEQVTAGGIIIPDTAKEKPKRGVVVAAGPGKPNDPTTVKEGEFVIYSKYAGTEFSLNGEDYLILRESEILMIE